jgi:hypothetical protein
MQIGDYRSRRKVTTKAFIADYTADLTQLHYVNFGNCLSSKQSDNIDVAEQMTAQKGYLQTTHEEPSKVALREELEFDEMTERLLRLIHLSTTTSSQPQNAGSGQTWSVDGAKRGYSYYVGARGISSFVVTGKTLGTDYTIDLSSGMLYILPASSINNTDIGGTYTQPTLAYTRYTSLGETFYRAYVRLEYYDQNTTAPREIKTGYAEVRVTDRGEFKGDAWTKVKLGVLWTGTPTVDSLELS